MINEDTVFLDIPRFFSEMDKENSVDEDVFDLPSGSPIFTVIALHKKSSGPLPPPVPPFPYDI